MRVRGEGERMRVRGEVEGERTRVRGVKSKVDFTLVDPDTAFLDLCRAQDSFIQRYNSNSARDPPTKLLPFCASHLRFRLL